LSAVLSVIWRPLVAALLLFAALRLLYSPEADQLIEHLVELILLTSSGFIVYAVVVFALWKLAGMPYGAEQLILEKLRFPMLKRQRP
jgi:hypothetical protein